MNNIKQHFLLNCIFRRNITSVSWISYLVKALLLLSITFTVLADERLIAQAIETAKLHDYNKDVIAVVSWNRFSNKHRFFLVSLKKKAIVYSWFTSHGINTGSQYRASHFSNVPGSRQSSKGIIRVSETYYGRYGYSARLDGISDNNSNIRMRNIVLHPSHYVSTEYMNTHEHPGRSWGCITLNPDDSTWIINQLKNGGLIINI